MIEARIHFGRPWSADAALYGFWAAGAVAAGAIFLVMALAVDPSRQIIHGVDGVGYTLWVRSFLGDGDLDFGDEIDAVHPGELPGSSDRTATGLRPDKYGVGCSLLATPFYAAARVYDRLTGATGAEAEQGWTRADRVALALSNIFWGWLGLVTTHRVVITFASPRASGWAISLLAAGTNVLYYFVREPFLSHLDSLFALSLATWLTRRAWLGRLGAGAWFAVGAATGLAASVRLTGLLFLVVPVSLLVRDALAQGRWRLDRALGMALGLGVGFAPQLLAWRTVYGSWWPDAYQGEGFTHLLDPRVVEVLFSSRHGLLSWSPLLILALLGLPELVRLAPAFGGALVVWALGLLWTNAAWEQWWLGHSFGHRGFICLFPLFAVGLALYLDGAARRPPLARLVLLVSAAVLWNGLLMLGYLAEMIPYSGAFSWLDFVVSLPALPGLVLRRLHGG